jgi:protein-S-isoprenylcysteine O-methyltransferase Ste14
VAPLPFTDPAARVVFFVVLGIFAALEVSIRIRSELNRGGERVDRGSVFVVVAAIVVGVGGGISLAGKVRGAGIHDGRWALFVAGVVVMVGGIAIRQWSVASLGRFFTVEVRVHENQTVVERGPYRWVRHPSYTGMILTFAGMGLALGNWASIVVLVVVPTAGLVVRIHFEERALLAGIGEPYRRFSATRAHLFPGVW